MKKVRITADAALAILRGIFEDDEVNTVIDDISAPEEWQGKTIGDILNVEYYTFKHRPVSTQTVINKVLEEKGIANHLEALDRAFCLCSLGDVERLYSKDVDMAALSVTLEYFIQTSKIKLLEYLIDDCNIALSGLRIPVAFGDETRKAVIFFGRPKVGDIQSTSPFGEAALVEIEAVIVLHPDVVSYSDYTVSVTFTDAAGAVKTCDIPLSSFSAVDAMTQEAVPYINNARKVGSINLSCANSFVLVFDGYTNPFIDYITDKALRAESIRDNNESFALHITRGEKTYDHTVIVKDHQTTVNADTGNETHTLSLVTRGLVNGTT